jgi:hypothetical protein
VSTILNFTATPVPGLLDTVVGRGWGMNKQVVSIEALRMYHQALSVTKILTVTEYLNVLPAE